MKLVTKAELLKMPKGTMFRRVVPEMFQGDWMLFDGACGQEDFFYTDVGPTIYSAVEGDNAARFKISDVGSRDGFFRKDDRYIVLDHFDRAAFASQILGLKYDEIVQRIAL